MPLPDINLDDRTFEQLQTELRRKIPAYTPEWTDFNESDPGITLIQLFSYLSEMIIYRLNQVPEKNRQAFLKMVGVDLNPPTPAVAELTFTLSSNKLTSAIPIPAGTQVQSSGAGGTAVFETDEDFLAVGFSLAQVQVCDGSRYTVIAPDDRKPGSQFPPFSAQPQAGAALYLGFDGAFPPENHRLTIHAAPRGNSPVAQSGAAQSSDSLPPVSGFWEYYTGSGLWMPLAVTKDETNCLTRTGIVLFDAPQPGTHASAPWGALQRPNDPPLFWVRYRIDQVLGAGFESQPMLEDVLLNTVTATNAVTETNELLGASTGLPDQSFTLAKTPVLPKDPDTAGVIAVDETGTGDYETWEEVPDLATAGPGDKVYAIQLGTGIVTFGDGIHGKIPTFVSSDNSNLLSSAQPNIIAQSYRWGGGSAGNTGPGTITSLNTIIPYVDSATNIREAAGGQDEQTVDEASAEVPAILRSQNRAVTAQDFADLARSTPGAQIIRAKAIPLYNPNLSVSRPAITAGQVAVSTSVPLPGVVTVVVIPYSTDKKPVPSVDTVQLVAGWLDTHRLITTEIYVTGPAYRKVDVQVSAIADPKFSIPTASQNLNSRLLAYFHPITGGPDGTGWDFGATIYRTEALRQILVGTPGIIAVKADSLQIYVDDVLYTGDVTLGPTEIVYSDQHRITVTYS